MKPPFKVALVGCGQMSKGWLGAVRDHFSDRCEVVSLVDLSVEQARKIAGEFALSSAWIGSSLDEALDQTHPDILFNCTIPEAHLPTCLTALAKGCHVLVEKPLAATLEEGVQLVAAAAKAGRTLAVIQNRRYLSAAIAVQAALASGVIGKLHTMNVDFYLGPRFGGFRETMKHPLLLDMAIHTFDQARFLCGLNAEKVFCLEHNPSGSWYSNGASASAIFQMSEGVVLNYRGSWCAQGMPTSWQGCWRLVGELGTLVWDGDDVITVEKVQEPRGSEFFQSVQRTEIPPVELSASHIGHCGNIGEFLGAIESGGKPQTAADDNILSLAMVEKAVASAESGEMVAF